MCLVGDAPPSLIANVLVYWQRSGVCTHGNPPGPRPPSRSVPRAVYTSFHPALICFGAAAHDNNYTSSSSLGPEEGL